MSDTLRYPSVPPKTLANDLSSTGTLIQLTECNDWGGVALTAANFNTTYIPGTLINDARTLAEFVLIDASTIANATTTGLLLYKRGLKYYAEGNATDLDEVTANKLPWTQGETKLLIGTNPPYMYAQFPAKGNDETITGLWTFPNDGNTPRLGSSYVAPTLDTQVATKGYVDAIAFAGAPDASTTVKGVIEIATGAELAAGTGTGGTGAVLVPAGDSFTNTPAGAGDENKVPVLDAAGRLASDFMPTVYSTTADGIQITTAPDSDDDGVNKAYVDATSLQNVFCDGSDGDVTIAAPTTLTRDMFYNNLTYSADITTAGFSIYVKGTLTRTGTAKIKNNGGNGGAGGNGSTANGGTAGTAGAAAGFGTLPKPGAAGAGGIGAGAAFAGGGTGAEAGSNGGAGDGAITNSIASVASITAATGGSATTSAGTGAGGTSASATTTQTVAVPRTPVTALNLLAIISGTVTPLRGAASSAGGGGGGVSTKYNGVRPGGGGGGGSGASGGTVRVASKVIVDSGTGTMFEAIGGNGGNGGNGHAVNPNEASAGGGAGGAGGNGGNIILLYKTKTGTCTTSVAGGTLGAAGTGESGSGGSITAPGTSNSGAAGLVIDIAL